MRWLVRLVTPPGGLVVDPFAGSGTTGIAAALEGFQFIGMEQDAAYAKIAEARIAFWTEHGEEGLRIVAEREKAEAEREAVVASGQLELL
jgi:site-specific DNA-methyltransferase (adenine-specific)